MVIGILYSEAGCGKSFQALSFEEPLIVLDMEMRLKEKIAKYYPEKLITHLQLKLYDKDFNEDKIGSFNGFVKEVIKITSMKSEDMPRSVVIDGIGDLRDYAHEKWCDLNKRKHAKNPGDWSQVNDLVRDTLFPLINWARVNNIDLIMTSQMKDEYTVIKKGDETESAKCGRMPSHKEFCSYNVDFLIELWQPKRSGKIVPGEYIATCTKSEVGSWEETVSGRKLYDVFIEKGMI